MKKIVSMFACISAVIAGSNSLAAIPEGEWGLLIDGCIREDLTISYNHPEKIDDKMFYGSFWFTAGSSSHIYEFGEPEISGNTAKCTAYGYSKYYDDYEESDDSMFYDDETEECLIIYDENSKSIRVNIGKQQTKIFTESDRFSFIICEGNNVNVRTKPVNGAKIGKLTKGQALPLISTSSVPNSKDVWYEIELPDAKKGYVSGRYVWKTTKNMLSIPADAIQPNIEYSRMNVNKDENDTYQETFTFTRKGNKVMAYYLLSFPLVFRLPGEFYYSGEIKNNQIILTKLFYGSDGQALFDQNNFSEFEKQAKIMNQPIILNYEGQSIYDEDGLVYMRNYDNY